MDKQEQMKDVCRQIKENKEHLEKILYHLNTSEQAKSLIRNIVDNATQLEKLKTALTIISIL